ncbi:hypothetical protein [Marinomonas algarum]|uniref:Uncharacterized protein n=1 Tax=Marinomonas algarum TaxID=2883105 RepID=A0A9X1LC19_9GAMM|nr:hypothetical protein [Marinomonas algarum]MCB5161519.1 hypothetical protein [Marinomonas algarum]
MCDKKLNFPFKGAREYVHGTSLFNAVVQAAVDKGLSSGEVNVSFKSMIHNPECVLEWRKPTPQDAVVAKFTSPYSEDAVICINEAKITGVAKRQDFDELEVCRGAVLGDMTITQEEPHHEDRIELLVSLCKKMHLECIDNSKKWVFSRYNGQFPIPKLEKVELRITKQVGTRLTCSDVIVNGCKIGDMYFS